VDLQLFGKRALVTESSDGIGKAIAKLLAARQFGSRSDQA